MTDSNSDTEVTFPKQNRSSNSHIENRGYSISEDSGHDLSRLSPHQQHELRSASRIPHVTSGTLERYSRMDDFMTVCRSVVSSVSHALTSFSRQAGLASSPSPSPNRTPKMTLNPSDYVVTQPVSTQANLGARPKGIFRDERSLGLPRDYRDTGYSENRSRFDTAGGSFNPRSTESLPLREDRSGA